MRELGLLAGTLALVCGAGTALACTVVTQLPFGAVKVIAKVPYGLGQTGILNIPAGVRNPPIILMAHGANGAAGAAGLQPEAEKIAYNTGAAVFNIDYSQGSAIQDFRCAARWMAEPANAAAYHFDQNRHGAIGFSSGAGPMAAAFLATQADRRDNAACPSAAPVFAQSVALFYGAYTASYAYVRNNAPTATKWLLVNGSNDHRIPIAQTPEMARQLTVSGRNVYWAATIAGLPHGFGVYSFKIWPQELPVACTVGQFFRLLH